MSDPSAQAGLAVAPVDPATGGEPPLVAPDPAPPPPPDPNEAEVQSLLRPVWQRCETDRILWGEVAAFVDGPWDLVERGVAQALVGRRYCKVSRDQIELGHLDWQGSKRIPL